MDRKAIVRKALLVLGVVVAVPVVAVGALLVTSGSSDGPSALFGGGPLEAGELVGGGEPDWSFAKDLPTIELQLLEPPRSRLIWVLVHDCRPFVVSGYMGSRLGRLWKRWPAQAETDGRAVIRIDGKRWERQLVRVRTGPDVAGVVAELQRKYGYDVTPADIEAGTTWMFEMKPRSGGSAR